MNATDEIIRYAQKVFSNIIAEMNSYGVHADEGLDLRPWSGVFCHYDINDRQVYLSVPDTSNPVGKFQTIILREMLGFESDDALLDFMRMLLPRFLSHEIAHHYRHRYGLFSNDLWYEEQVANHLATALTKLRMSPQERPKMINIVRKTIAALSGGKDTIETDSYHSAIHVLRMGGMLEKKTFEKLMTMGFAFSVDPEDLLRSSSLANGELENALERHDISVAEFRENYCSDWNRYLRAHLSWLILDLESPQNYYPDEFAREYLGIIPRTFVLERCMRHSSPERGAVAAFRAHMALSGTMPVASRYFYRRYRSIILEYLESEMVARKISLGTDLRNFRSLFDSWSPGEPDSLELAKDILPESLQKLLPENLIANETSPGNPPDDLPESTDERIWLHATGHHTDGDAAKTLEQLALLEKIDLFCALPVDVLLKMASSLIRHRYKEGEYIIWAGNEETDVYLMIKGSASVHLSGNNKTAENITTGQTFGEIAFLTLETRSASVCALETCEVFVLKSNHLRTLGLQYPIIFSEMARALASRLARI